MIQIQLHKWAELDVYQRKAVLRRPAVADDMGTREGAAAIVGDVRQNGAEAKQQRQEVFEADKQKTAERKAPSLWPSRRESCCWPCRFWSSTAGASTDGSWCCRT